MSDSEPRRSGSWEEAQRHTSPWRLGRGKSSGIHSGDRARAGPVNGWQGGGRADNLRSSQQERSLPSAFALTRGEVG
jgi:hypothetical protein